MSASLHAFPGQKENNCVSGRWPSEHLKPAKLESPAEPRMEEEEHKRDSQLSSVRPTSDGCRMDPPVQCHGGSRYRGDEDEEERGERGERRHCRPPSLADSCSISVCLSPFLPLPIKRAPSSGPVLARTIAKRARARL